MSGAVLSLDAADMSGVHNTDFASNGEVHKVQRVTLLPAMMYPISDNMVCCMLIGAA